MAGPVPAERWTQPTTREWRTSSAPELERAASFGERSLLRTLLLSAQHLLGLPLNALVLVLGEVAALSLAFGPRQRADGMPSIGHGVVARRLTRLLGSRFLRKTECFRGKFRSLLGGECAHANRLPVAAVPQPRGRPPVPGRVEPTFGVSDVPAAPGPRTAGRRARPRPRGPGPGPFERCCARPSRAGRSGRRRVGSDAWRRARRRAPMWASRRRRLRSDPPTHGRDSSRGSDSDRDEPGRASHAEA